MATKVKADASVKVQTVGFTPENAKEVAADLRTIKEYRSIIDSRRIQSFMVYAQVHRAANLFTSVDMTYKRAVKYGAINLLPGDVRIRFFTVKTTEKGIDAQALKAYQEYVSKLGARIICLTKAVHEREILSKFGFVKIGDISWAQGAKPGEIYAKGIDAPAKPKKVKTVKAEKPADKPAKKVKKTTKK